MLKPESFQRSGSFKFRGAYNRLSQLTEEERAAGVVAYSSGNHGAAVALAARLLGIPAVIVVPIVSAASSRQASTNAGSSACVIPHRPQRSRGIKIFRHSPASRT
jgi:threonine dehydratase